jgi:hypothetical protein
MLTLPFWPLIQIEWTVLAYRLCFSVFNTTIDIKFLRKKKFTDIWLINKIINEWSMVSDGLAAVVNIAVNISSIERWLLRFSLKQLSHDTTSLRFTPCLHFWRHTVGWLLRSFGWKKGQVIKRLASTWKWVPFTPHLNPRHVSHKTFGATRMHFRHS